MYQRILVPLDGSATSARGLDEALQLARLTGGRVRLVHIIDELSFALAMDAYGGTTGDWIKTLKDEGQGVLDRATARAREAGVSDVEGVLHERTSGSVSDLVTRDAQAWGADLIVLGTHGRRGVGRMLLGSSAEQILRTASVPVLLVRAPAEEAAPATEGSADPLQRPTVPPGTVAYE